MTPGRWCDYFGIFKKCKEELCISETLFNEMPSGFNSGLFKEISE